MQRCKIQTPLGAFEAFYTSRGITRISLPPGPERIKCRARHTEQIALEFMRKFADDLNRYFKGECVFFGATLDLGSIGSFDRQVLAVLRTIPYSEVRSYGWVARRIGIPAAARAVGGACRRNPCPIIIPCHRVIEAGGSLGGYSSGVVWKRYLLSLEKKYKKQLT